MKKIFLFLVLILNVFFCININAEQSLCSGAKSAILVEASTKKILFEKEKDAKRAPASMTKIMTLLLIYEEIDNNKISKSDLVVTSDYAKSMGGSQVYLEEGEKLSVDEMLKCICICSANDCAVAMAEHICGSESKFVEKMNEKAKELGCLNTHFEDASGLTSVNHYSSSYDMALISCELVNNHPDVLNYTSLKEDYIRKDSANPFWLVNTNKLLGHLDGLKGLKTGFTSEAMYCISLVMEKNDMTLISVVMGYETSLSRNSESATLLKYGFANYEKVKIIEKGTVYAIINNINFTPEENYVVSKNDLYIIQDKNNPIDYSVDFNYKLNNENYNSSLGKVKIMDLEGNLLAEGDLVLKEKVKKNNFFEKILIIIKKILK